MMLNSLSSAQGLAFLGWNWNGSGMFYWLGFIDESRFCFEFSSTTRIFGRQKNGDGENKKDKFS